MEWTCRKSWPPPALENAFLLLVAFSFSFKILNFYLNVTSTRNTLSIAILFSFSFSHLNKDWWWFGLSKLIGCDYFCLSTSFIEDPVPRFLLKDFLIITTVAIPFSSMNFPFALHPSGTGQNLEFKENFHVHIFLVVPSKKQQPAFIIKLPNHALVSDSAIWRL